MYKHPEAVHIRFVGKIDREKKKNIYIKQNCSLLHALASVQEVRGILRTTTSHSEQRY